MHSGRVASVGGVAIGDVDRLADVETPLRRQAERSVGVTGTVGTPSQRAAAASRPSTGWISSEPITATGTTGVPVAIATRAKERPKRASR